MAISGDLVKICRLIKAFYNSRNILTILCVQVPTSVRHPRGRHLPQKVEKPKNTTQGAVERLVRQYTNGIDSESDFRKGLSSHGVQADAQFNKLIAKHEAGNFVSHNQFGKEALRRVIDPAAYNHSNKVTLKNPSYVGKDNQGGDPVKFSSGITQTYHEDTTIPMQNQRVMHEVTGQREIFGKKVYLGVKGKSKIPVQEQVQSSDPDITKWDKGAVDVNVEDQYKPKKTMVYNERDHHKMYSNHGTAQSMLDKQNDIHRTSYTAHPANRTSFNIFGF
jgi:hypothetical protein